MRAQIQYRLRVVKAEIVTEGNEVKKSPGIVKQLPEEFPSTLKLFN